MRWRLFARNTLAVLGLAVLLSIGLASLFAPLISPYSPEAINLRNMLQGSSAEHLLGTDNLGRDVLSRLLYAGRTSFSLALGVVVLTTVIGSILGALAGFFAGRMDSGISLLVDTMLSIPSLALAMVASAFVELTTYRLVVILSLVSWPTIARLVRAQVISLKAQSFAEASAALGARALRTLFGHIFPNTLTPVIVAASLLVANAILIESALSFLGFGVPPPTATWGGMLNESQLYYREAPWLAIFPGIVITLVVSSINFVGEGLREAFDSRQRL